jgi:glycosyltransferase involved in cell wall biosynthesis
VTRVLSRTRLLPVNRQRSRAERLSESVAATGDPAQLLEAYRAHLDLADRHLARNEMPEAASSFARAVGLAFDRGTHFDSVTSPLARDPQGFTAPLRDSRLAQRLRAPRGRTAAAGVVPGDRDPSATRTAVVTRENMNFLGEILELLRAHPRVELDHVDVTGDTTFSRGIFKPHRVVEEILTGQPGMARRVERVLRHHVDEADVLFVEWCSALAVLVNLIDPGDTRVVVRMHSYEAFTHWPHLLDFSRIDDLLFVSEHLRDFAVDVVPGLRGPDAPRLHVLPLAKDLTGYARPKPPEARFRLGLVGWNAVAKDPLWALDVLRALRAEDERYTIDLVGSDFATHLSPTAARYGERLERELAELEAAGAVRRVGQTDDVAGALSQIGTVLSTSVRESFHAGLVEGAASGAVPVVRDWPFFAGRATSARTLYPGPWVVATPADAAQRVLGATADEDTWRAAGTAAAAHALATWDWSVVRPGYERLFLG